MYDDIVYKYLRKMRFSDEHLVTSSCYLLSYIHAVLRKPHEVLNIDLAVVAAAVMKARTSPEPPV